jgi:hypothetical protein
MSVTLVPHVPDYLVPRGVEHRMEGNGKFYHPQIGSQMPAVFLNGRQDQFPNLRRQTGKFRNREEFYIPRSLDPGQKRIGHLKKPQQKKPSLKNPAIGPW